MGHGHWLWDLVLSWGQGGRTMTKLYILCCIENLIGAPDPYKCHSYRTQAWGPPQLSTEVSPAVSSGLFLHTLRMPLLVRSLIAYFVHFLIPVLQLVPIASAVSLVLRVWLLSLSFPPGPYLPGRSCLPTEAPGPASCSATLRVFDKLS